MNKFFPKLTLLAAVGALLFAVSCDMLEDLIPSEIVPKLSSSSIEIPAEGGSVQLFVTSPTSWTIHSQEDWFSISPSSGIGAEETEVTISADKNTTGSERTATISLVVSTYATISATVSQKAVDDVTPNRVEAVTVEPKNVEIKVGDTIAIQAYVSPEGVDAQINWLSLSSCCDVDANGVVTGLSEGTGTVIAYVGEITSVTDLSGVVFGECIVTVKKDEPADNSGSSLEDPENGGNWDW